MRPDRPAVNMFPPADDGQTLPHARRQPLALPLVAVRFSKLYASVRYFPPARRLEEPVTVFIRNTCRV